MKVGNFKMESKFLLNQEQSNLYKFIIIYKRFLNKQLNGNEFINFKQNLKLLKAENKPLDELITDENFLDNFIFKWENQFINYDILIK